MIYRYVANDWGRWFDSHRIKAFWRAIGHLKFRKKYEHSTRLYLLPKQLTQFTYMVCW